MTLFWSGIGALFILLAIFSYWPQNPSDEEVLLVIDFGGGEERKFVSPYRAGSSAWDILQQANAVYGIPLEVEDHFKPKMIGEKENGQDGKSWRFYLNGRPSEESPFESPLSGGEKILFKFE